MSVTGTWNLTLNSPLGDQAATLNLEEDGGVLQGTLTGKGDSGPVQRLTVEGDTVSFAADADTPGPPEPALQRHGRGRQDRREVPDAVRRLRLLRHPRLTTQPASPRPNHPQATHAA